MTENIIEKLQLGTDIKIMRARGDSIRSISKELSQRCNVSISRSNIHRFLSRTTTSVPISISVNIAPEIKKFLDLTYGQRIVSRSNVDFVTGHARTTLQKKFGMNHARACEIMKEYCKSRGWVFEKPLMKMKISFKNPEENHRRMWI